MTWMWAKPSAFASPRANSTPASVFFSVGVMRKFAGAKSTRWAFSTPLRSLPAMGWLAMNSTPSGSSACTFSTSPAFTPDTSVQRQPAGKSAPYFSTHCINAVGYNEK